MYGGDMLLELDGPHDPRPYSKPKEERSEERSSMVGYGTLLERCTNAQSISTNTAFEKVKKQKARTGEYNSTVIGRRIDGTPELKYADWL